MRRERRLEDTGLGSRRGTRLRMLRIRGPWAKCGTLRSRRREVYTRRSLWILEQVDILKIVWPRCRVRLRGPGYPLCAWRARGRGHRR